MNGSDVCSRMSEKDHPGRLVDELIDVARDVENGREGMPSTHSERLITVGFYAGTPDFSGNRNYAMLSSFIPSDHNWPSGDICLCNVSGLSPSHDIKY